MSFDRPEIPKHIRNMIKGLADRDKKRAETQKEIDAIAEQEFPQLRETDIQRLDVVSDMEFGEMEDDKE